MSILNFTLLEIEQIFGDEQLEIFKKRGTRAAISDYALCLGGDVFYCNGSYACVGNTQKLENRTGCYWAKTNSGDNKAAYTVGWNGTAYAIYVYSREIGVRVALSFSSLSNICSKKVVAQDGIIEVEYGEYPQSVTSKELQKTLEELWESDRLSKTEKEYTRDSATVCKKFMEFPQQEYEYNGKKYVRVRVGTEVRRANCVNPPNVKLSNEVSYEPGGYVWIEVEPIKWLVDEKNNIAVSEKILFAGVQFKHIWDYKGGEDFENTDLKWFLDTFFSREIISSNIQTKQEVPQVELQPETKVELPSEAIELPKTPILADSIQKNDSLKTEKKEIEIPKVELQPETRNPIIEEVSFPIQPGVNIILDLPEEWLNIIDTITIKSEENMTNEVVYVKKRGI